MIRKLSPSAILNIDVSTKRMRALEWTLTALSIAYAIYDPNWLSIPFAALALVMTAINPTTRIQKSLKGRFVKPPKSHGFAKPVQKQD